MAQPAPCHLNELGPDPGGTVAADPLIAFHDTARPGGWRHADPARELPAVAEPAVEDFMGQQGCVVRADHLQPGSASQSFPPPALRYSRTPPSAKAPRLGGQLRCARPRPARSAAPPVPSAPQAAGSPPGLAAGMTIHMRSSLRRTSPRTLWSEAPSRSVRHQNKWDC